MKKAKDNRTKEEILEQCNSATLDECVSCKARIICIANQSYMKPIIEGEEMPKDERPLKDTVSLGIKELILRDKNMLMVDTIKALSDRIEEVERNSRFGEQAFGRGLRKYAKKPERFKIPPYGIYVQSDSTEESLVKSSKEWTLSTIVEQLEFVGYRSGTHHLVNNAAFIALKEMAKEVKK